MNEIARAFVALLVAQLLAATAVAAASPAEDDAVRRTRYGQLDRLAGFCWSGTFDNGARDVHCWEWVIQDQFLRDRHRVAGGEEVYSGDTLYGWDADDERLRFWYFNSLGGVSEGTVEPDGDRLRFDESYEDATQTATIRSFLEMPDEDRYQVVSERQAGEAWEPFMSIEYQRLGTRPAAVGGEFSASGDLVFNTDRDGDWEVYRLDLASGVERNLTATPGTDWVYTGGERPVAVSQRDSESGYRLYRLDSQSGAMTAINDFPVADSWVGVLPAGRGWVVCAVEAGDKELYLLGPDGKIERQLTDNDADDCQPDVTPDGATVVFWSNRGGSGEIWSMPLAGGEPRQLTSFAGNDRAPRHRYGGEGPPRISPDGESIAWMSMRHGETFDVYTMAIDGSEVRQVTDHLGDDGYPSWSPDGAWLAFDSERYGSSDLFVVRPDGSDLTRVTAAEGMELAPAWVPKAAGGQR